MGDRTYTAITINKYHYDRIKDQIDDNSYEDLELEEDQVKFTDCEANYGTMEALENVLQETKTEYDKRWEAGGEYCAGEEFARKVNGEYMIQEISDEGAAVITELKLILAETDPIKREALLNKRLKELEPFEVKPLAAPQSIDFIKNA